MPNEYPLPLTPQQAASGAVQAVDLPFGQIGVRVPAGVPNGALIEIGQPHLPVTVHLRVHIADSDAVESADATDAAQDVIDGSSLVVELPKQAPKERRRRRIAVWAVAGTGLGLAVVLFLAVTSGNSQPTPIPPSLLSSAPATDENGDYAVGTCLNGSIPDGTATTSADVNVNPVSCTAPDAHFKVLASVDPLNETCAGVEGTQYELTVTTVSQIVALYCLQGLGLYASGGASAAPTA